MTIDQQKLTTDYDYAFKLSLGFIRMYARHYRIDYFDLFDECMYVFYFDLKQKFPPINCYRISKKRYKFIAFSIVKKRMQEENYIKSNIVVRELFYSLDDYIYDIDWNGIGLNTIEKYICIKIIEGFEYKEIKCCSAWYIKQIRKKLGEYYGIKYEINTRPHKSYVCSNKKLEQLKRARSNVTKPNGRPKKQVGIYKDNKLVKVFDSCADASRYLTNGKSNQVVTTSMARNTRYKGYSFEYM